MVGRPAVFVSPKLSLYSYGDELNGIRYFKEFYKIICTNCGITSGIQFGLDDVVKCFFEACVRRDDMTDLVMMEVKNDN